MILIGSSDLAELIKCKTTVGYGKSPIRPFLKPSPLQVKNLNSFSSSAEVLYSKSVAQE